ncbi:tetratricopeptide repeat protein [Aquabacterium sp. A7-Y]|uniref:tetratricopeptide repeat protein n=1 Tax=Aquabacterium sp. A7-Y TaxID=1349605 RepID=UPI00223DACA4|nr:tetratricopeptide repeat protein [Aquabacterium sp. A7-Y]MCW7542116.1 tetratricopeptide repeat protein [Aquabacterium sp. A7-Y]
MTPFDPVTPATPSGGAAALSRPLRSLGSSELLERIAEAGFLASECGLHMQAETIFSALAAAKPGHPSPLIGLALSHARMGRLDGAIDELRAVVERCPDSDMARAMLGTLLVHAQQPGALPLFEAVIASGRDSSAVNVARGCLELARALDPSAGPADPGITRPPLNIRP